MGKGEYSVDWEKVQSTEYRKRLSALSEDEKVISSIETRAKWALNNRDVKETEELYAINLSNGTEIGRITDQHYRKKIKRTPDFTTKLNAADDFGDKILLIHNHPDVLPPSIDDTGSVFQSEPVLF